MLDVILIDVCCTTHVYSTIYLRTVHQTIIYSIPHVQKMHVYQSQQVVMST